MSFRSTFVAARASLAQEYRRWASNTICQRLLSVPVVQQAKTLGLYCSIRAEVNTQPLLDHLLSDTVKSISLPVVNADEPMHYRRHQLNQPLILSNWNIPEPEAIQPRVEPNSLDVAVVPMVAFTRNCDRLGWGQGCYDKTFAFRLNSQCKTPVLIGLAFDCQQADTLTVHSWDVPMDIIVTESQLYSL